jgi:hypothetical protein
VLFCTTHTYATQSITCSDVHVWRRTSKKYTTFVLCMVGSVVEAYLFGSMKENEEFDQDHTWIDNSNA